ncbi:MAG: Mur ligase family protein [Bacteroidota bacterium]|nr:Mur ligase family protein [Bacteroidota bacterium]MDP4218420.1 Mur ligase family protein [Bacteroidota bacterium]MDP4247030.1 Mur ligase family protein [Bacteroidota bacterium]MDP4254891.1 Mur ligase family protein [Bacteroidota bacterium]MDP4260193.1 Mur ligase family protein [Bacteroidota bacterium]
MKRVHFIAIGGSVMHQLAIALHRKGYAVTGSDDEIFEPARSNLEKEGLMPPGLGWRPEFIRSTTPEAIILGMHAKADNPEILIAKELGIPMYSFPEYIYQESRDKTRVVIGGSHGKTTTTSMIMHVLKQVGRDFDWLVGARLDGFSQSVSITGAPIIVCEGDEYPASAMEKRPKFHFLFPHIAVLTGIAWDHINVFPTFAIYLEQFRIFIDKIEPGGLLIYNETDPILEKLVKEHPSGVRRIGYGVPAHRVDDGITVAQLDRQTGPLKVFGDHNLLNLHAAFLVCKELGIDAAAFMKSIANFTGAAKRLELLAQNDHVNAYRDFAHAPSKVKATIDAVKRQFPGRSLIAVLELHTFSSLNEKFLSEYRGAMDQADQAVVFYSRHALELKRLPTLPKEKVKEGFGKNGLIVINEKQELEAWLTQQSYENVNLLFMSSGDYDGLDIMSLANRITQ